MCKVHVISPETSQKKGAKKLIKKKKKKKEKSELFPGSFVLIGGIFKVDNQNNQNNHQIERLQINKKKVKNQNKMIEN